MKPRNYLTIFLILLAVMLFLASCDTLPSLPLFDLSELQIPSFRALQPDGFLPEPPPLSSQPIEDDNQIPIEDITTLEEAPGLDWFLPSKFINSNWNVNITSEAPARINLEPKTNQPEQVKLLFLYTKGHPVFDRSVSFILATITGREINSQSTVILIDPSDEEQGQKALEVAEDENFDLIFTAGSSPTAYAHEHYRGSDIPIVSVLAKDPVLLGQMTDFESGSGSNIAYTSVSVPIELQLSYFRQLVPDLTYVIVIYDENNASTVAAQVEPLNNYGISRGLEIIQVAVSDPEQSEDSSSDQMPDTETQLKERIPAALDKALAGDPSLEHSLIVVTSSSLMEKNFDTINELSAGYPVVSLFNELVREGQSSALMSISVSFDSNSILAAVYGSRILEGEDPGSLPVGVITPPDVRINFAKVRELDMQIPFSFFENATIIFGPTGELVRDWSQ